MGPQILTSTTSPSAVISPPWLSSSLASLQARRMQKILCFRSKTFCQWKGRCPEKLSPCSDVYDLRGSCASQLMPPYYIWGPPTWTLENSSNTLIFTTISPSVMAATLLHFVMCGLATPSFKSQVITPTWSHSFKTRICNGGGNKASQASLHQGHSAKKQQTH